MDKEDSLLEKVSDYLGDYDGIKSGIIALEAYDCDYGICPHEDGMSSPLSLVEMHPAENYVVGGRLDSLMHEYKERRVKEHLGISFLELIKQPRHVVDRMLNFSREAEMKELRSKNAEMARVAAQAASVAAENKNRS